MWPFLNEEQRIALDGFSRFCKTRIQPAIEPYANKPGVPRDILQAQLKKFTEYGLGNGRLAVESGGMELDVVTWGLLYEEACRLTGSVANVAFINEASALALEKLGSDTIISDYVRPLAAGEHIAGSAFTEPSGGSDVASIRARATRRGNSYVISGQKVWITNAQYADFVTVLARTEDTGQLDLYLVDREKHGYEVRPLETVGLITTGELFFDGVEIPLNYKLNTEGKGLGAALDGFQAARAFIAVDAVGRAQAAQDAAITYARERNQFGKPIGAHQLIQQHLADNAVEIDAARLLAYRALELSRQGEPCAVEASMAKLYATEMVQRVVYRALQVHGAYGLSPEFPLEALYRSVRASTIFEGTSEIQRLIIGKALTGLSAF